MTHRLCRFCYVYLNFRLKQDFPEILTLRYRYVNVIRYSRFLSVFSILHIMHRCTFNQPSLYINNCNCSHLNSFFTIFWIEKTFYQTMGVPVIARPCHAPLESHGYSRVSRTVSTSGLTFTLNRLFRYKYKNDDYVLVTKVLILTPGLETDTGNLIWIVNPWKSRFNTPSKLIPNLNLNILDIVKTC